MVQVQFHQAEFNKNFSLAFNEKNRWDLEGALWGYFLKKGLIVLGRKPKELRISVGTQRKEELDMFKPAHI